MSEHQLTRIAEALERIADALEPRAEDDKEWGSFFDHVALIAESLGDDSDGALARIHACLSDISDAVTGEDTNKTPIATSLEDIAYAAKTR